MTLILDPPAYVFAEDGPQRFDDWIEELKAMKRDYTGDPDALQTIDLAIEEAQELRRALTDLLQGDAR